MLEKLGLLSLLAWVTCIFLTAFFVVCELHCRTTAPELVDSALVLERYAQHSFCAAILFAFVFIFVIPSIDCTLRCKDKKEGSR